MNRVASLRSGGAASAVVTTGTAPSHSSTTPPPIVGRSVTNPVISAIPPHVAVPSMDSGFGSVTNYSPVNLGHHGHSPGASRRNRYRILSRTIVC